MLTLTKETCEHAIMGGLLLGGGGGGTLDTGRRMLEETFAHTASLTMLGADELSPDDIVVTVSTLGAPSAKDMRITPEQWLTVLKNFELNCGEKISGFCSCENGACSTANGWLLSALTGIPVIDAPCNGRAHPSGTMGSIGLNLLPEYMTVQSCCGGTGSRYIETVAKGGLIPTSDVIRRSAAVNGGMVGVLRNPVRAEYLLKNGAPGAIAQAIKIGEAFMKCSGCEEFISFLQKELGAAVLIRGLITDYDLKMEGGYDIGTLGVANDQGTVRLTFWNEYMLAENAQMRLSTFPDLICTLDAATGEAVSTAEAQNGREVVAVAIPRENLILGAGMRQRELFKEVEGLVHKDMTICNDGLFVKQQK